ncbi:hypothetical protein VE01_08792 [Pseudogymnoascus verrucosus]|uniref:Zn(2)-C6 fungal-type domain-containing protein n=1 Tax=Pseudogymnoascus verrucosus TaxID=342668 RepID=A0A1B8GC22_9PEZI|nr:uncharacterized protein VE01_08792 [Pseudogymnoascus verrucosus]OBT93382.2 hypothetical protein VE01_08792 [Pseudogymnoascus verrucosus]
MSPPAVQRKRVAQACDRCRSRKDKCDGAKPVCSACAVRGHSCSYDPAVKKRGLPEGYVRGLENLWGFTIREAPEVEANVISLMEQRHGTDALPRGWNSKDGEALSDTWRKSRLSRELDSLLPLLDITDDRPAKRRRQDSSFTPPTEASAFDPAFVPPRETYPVKGEQQTSSAIFPAPIFNGASSSEAMKLTDSQQIHLPHNAWELLDVYFSYTHCWLPIIEKHNSLRASYLYPTSISSSMPGSGDHAALWAILAYAECHQAIIRRNMTHGLQQNDPWMASDTYKTARSLIPDEDGVFELGHIQSLLILTLLNMGMNRWKQAWSLIGQAVRMALELRLEKCPDDAKSRNRHTFFGCFVLETLVAARLNRSPHLRAQDALNCGLLLEDGSDEWSPWVDSIGIRRNSESSSRGPASTLSTFNRLVQISAVLNAIVCGYSIGAEDHGKFDLLLRKFGWDSKALDKPGPPLLPHQYHLSCLYSATRAPVHAHQRGQASRAEESLPDLLDGLRKNYGLAAVPPTFDCLAHVYIRQYASHGRTVASEEALNSLEELLTEMAQTWPTFQDTLLELGKFRSSMSGANVPLSRFSNLPNTNPTTTVGKDINLKESRPQRHPSLDEPMNTPSSSEYTSSGQAILEAAIQFDPSLLLMDDEIKPISTPWSLPVGNLTLAANSPNIPQPSGGPASLPYYPMFDSQTDDDALFNEFATLDAMKWTNNWDQSLQNLGFTDLDNMKQDFHAFFQEPNLRPSNEHDMGDHLMAGSAALMEYPSPHMEASQILQALSASEIPVLPSRQDGG